MAAPDAELPRWARHYPSRTCEMDTDDRETFYLQTMAYHVVARRVSASLHHSRDQSLRGVRFLEDVKLFLDQFQPHAQEEEDENSAAAILEEDSSMDQGPYHDLEQPTHYPPTILPIAMVYGPPSQSDRQDVVRYLHRGLSSFSQAVCLLRVSPQMTHSDLYKCLFQQCLAQETDPTPYMYLLKPRKKKNHQSYREALLLWAGTTTSFDGLHIILENLEQMDIATWNPFLESLTTLRSCEGLPVSLVCLRIRSADDLLWSSRLRRSAYGNEAGIMVREFTIPGPREVYDAFVDNLVMGGNNDDDDDDRSPPLFILLRGTSWRTIHEVFVNNHQSPSLVAKSIQLACAHHLAQQGSFLVALDDDDFWKHHWQRVLCWACWADKEHKFLSGGSILREWQHSIRTVPRVLACMLRVMRQLCCCDGATTSLSRTTTTMELLQCMSTSMPKANISTILGNVAKLSLDSVLAVLADVRRELRECLSRPLPSEVGSFEPPLNENGNTFRELRRLYQKVNELIVLMDDQTAVQSHVVVTRDKMTSVEAFLHDLFDWSTACFTRPESINLVSLSVETYDQAADFQWSLDARPRKKVAEAMAGAVANLGLVKSCVAPEACELFLSFDRIVITMDELFERFSKCFSEDDDDDVHQEHGGTWVAFAFAIYQLTRCGLLRKRSGGRGDVAYEKETVVWSR